MYVRPPNYRYPHSVRVPDNYSGNAFSEPPAESSVPPQAPDEAQEAHESQIHASEEPSAKENQDTGKAEQASLLSPRGFRLRLGSIFGKDRGIGTEELLIIALILLLSDNDDGFDDLILMLALLFFIK